MKRLSLVCLTLFCLLVVITTELPAQIVVSKSAARDGVNQVFVKVIVPVTSRTPKQDGAVVESWVAEHLKDMGESEYFAVTDWVQVCDGLLEDDIVNNDVWEGWLNGKHVYCPVGGDLPERENGRVLVNLRGWTPGGGEANIVLADEPGSRAVGLVRLSEAREGKRLEIEKGLPYVAVMIAPPPHVRDTPRGKAN